MKEQKKKIWFRFEKPKLLRNGPHIGDGNKNTPNNVDNVTVEAQYYIQIHMSQRYLPSHF